MCILDRQYDLYGCGVLLPMQIYWRHQCLYKMNRFKITFTTAKYRCTGTQFGGTLPYLKVVGNIHINCDCPPFLTFSDPVGSSNWVFSIPNNSKDNWTLSWPILLRYVIWQFWIILYHNSPWFLILLTPLFSWTHVLDPLPQIWWNTLTKHVTKTQVSADSY